MIFLLFWFSLISIQKFFFLLVYYSSYFLLHTCFTYSKLILFTDLLFQVHLLCLSSPGHWVGPCTPNLVWVSICACQYRNVWGCRLEPGFVLFPFSSEWLTGYYYPGSSTHSRAWCGPCLHPLELFCCFASFISVVSYLAVAVSSHVVYLLRLFTVLVLA